MGERRDSPTATRAADGLGDVPTAPFPPVADDGPVLPGVNAQIPPAQHVRVFGSRAYFRLWLAQVVSSLGDWIGFVAIVALGPGHRRLLTRSGDRTRDVRPAHPGLLLQPVRGRARRSLGPQEGHGLLRHRSRPRARDLAVHRHGVGIGRGVAAARDRHFVVGAGQGGVGSEPRAAGSAGHRELALTRRGLRHVPHRQLRVRRPHRGCGRPRRRARLRLPRCQPRDARDRRRRLHVLPLRGDDRDAASHEAETGASRSAGRSVSGRSSPTSRRVGTSSSSTRRCGR